MGFIMDGLDAEDYDRQYGDRELLGRIGAYFKPAARAMVIVGVMISLHSIAQIIPPIAISWGIDQVMDDRIDEVLWLLVGIVLLSGVGAWGFNYIRQILTARVVGNVVLALPSDSDDFANVVTLTMNLLSQILLVFIVIGVLYSRNAFLATVSLAMAPIVWLVATLFRKMARESTQRSQRSTARVNNAIQEAMNGIAVAKNFRQEQSLYNEFQPINRQNYQVMLRQGLVFSSIFPILFLVAGLGTIVLVYLGGRQVIDGGISAGDWFLFFQSVMIFWGPITSIASFWSQFQQGLSASERIFALIDAEPEVVQHASEHPGRISGQIEC